MGQRTQSQRTAGQNTRTQAELHHASKNDETQSGQLSVGKHILDTHGPLHVERVHCRQNHWNNQPTQTVPENTPIATAQFLPRNAMHKRGLCRHAVSVRLPVTFVDHVKTNKRIFELFSPSGSHTTVVFPYKTGWRYSHGNPPNGGVKCRWDIGRNSDYDLIAGYRRLLDVRSAKNIYRRRSWVYDTVGHAPLAIDRLLDSRTTKWQKQLPTTMQCRSHSRRRTIECLFVTACSMTNTPKRREQKRI